MPQAERANAIMQTAGTTTAEMAGTPADSMASAENPAGYSDLNPQGGGQPFGRTRLQPAVTHAYWSSQSEGSDNAEDQRSADEQASQSLSHPNHPLAD
jgi:hypothetical protein